MGDICRGTALRGSAVGLLAVLVLAACTSAPDAPGARVQDSRLDAAAADTPSASGGTTYGLPGQDDDGPWFACTEIGNAEGVGVDLSQVLSLEGGDYDAEVSVPSLGARSTRGFAGNDGYYPAGDVEADLTGEPVEVHVRVVTERGDVAYETSDVVQPVLFQPNGARCDGENYSVGLVATPDGRLVPGPGEGFVTDAGGRWTEAVDTRCGVEYLSSAQGELRRVGGLLDDGAGGPPPGWNTPAQRGWVTPQADGSLLFEDERGHSERFAPVTDGWFPAACG